jgi:hypothetical protein
MHMTDTIKIYTKYKMYILTEHIKKQNNYTVQLIYDFRKGAECHLLFY